MKSLEGKDKLAFSKKESPLLVTAPKAWGMVLRQNNQQSFRCLTFRVGSYMFAFFREEVE